MKRIAWNEPQPGTSKPTWSPLRRQRLRDYVHTLQMIDVTTVERAAAVLDAVIRPCRLVLSAV